MVRNTKAKIRRTHKNYGVDLSDEIDIPSIENFKTRKEYNEWKEKVDSFTNRNNLNYQFKKNDYGVVASKKELNQIERATKQAQRVADELREKANKKPFISGGKEQGTVGQRMLQMGRPNTAGIYRPPDFDFDKIRSKKQLEEKKKNMEERSNPNFIDERAERLKQNYYETLEKFFNSDADDLIDRIKEIPADDFFELFLQFDEFQFDFLYTEEQSQNTLNKLMSVIEQYNDGKINMDLKGF